MILDNAARYDECGFLVRLIFGRKPRVYRIPGRVTHKVWRFPHGLAVRNQSLSIALNTVDELAGKKSAEDDHEC